MYVLGGMLWKAESEWSWGKTGDGKRSRIPEGGCKRLETEITNGHMFHFTFPTHHREGKPHTVWLAKRVWVSCSSHNTCLLIIVTSFSLLLWQKTSTQSSLGRSSMIIFSFSNGSVFSSFYLCGWVSQFWGEMLFHNAVPTCPYPRQEEE